MGILMMSNMVLGWVLGFDVLAKVFFFTCSVPSFVFFYLISADKRFRFLFTFCLADTTALWVMAATNLLDHYFGGGTYVLMFFSRLAAFPSIWRTDSCESRIWNCRLQSKRAGASSRG